MKLGISNRKAFDKFKNMLKFNNILLNNQWLKEKTTKEI